MTDVQPEIDLNMKGRSETQVEDPSAYSNATRGNMEPVKLSNDDYTWYLNTERDILAYIVTYIQQCDIIAIRYLQKYLYYNSSEFIQEGHQLFHMLDNMIKYKIHKASSPQGSNTNTLKPIDVYKCPDVNMFFYLVGSGSSAFQFHTPCVRGLVHFIDTNQQIVSEFDFDRHQALYQVIDAHMKWKQQETKLRKERWDREEKQRAQQRKETNASLFGTFWLDIP